MLIGIFKKMICYILYKVQNIKQELPTLDKLKLFLTKQYGEGDLYECEVGSVNKAYYYKKLGTWFKWQKL